VKEFTGSVSVFHNKFAEEGPGTVGEDLDDGMYLSMCNLYINFFPCFIIGVKKLKDFQAEFAELEKERQELVNAEKLFDLPITLYSDLIEVDNHLQGMAKVFELYEAQRVCLF